MLETSTQDIHRTVHFQMVNFRPCVFSICKKLSIAYIYKNRRDGLGSVPQSKQKDLVDIECIGVASVLALQGKAGRKTVSG